jgi:ribonucleoside-diphosphate reductase alpha chain
MAQISKFGGGIGVYLGNIRSRGGSIRGIKGCAGGVNPWVKVINDTAIAVNQLGARMGSISVTLDVWHRDIYDFLDLQTETGDIRSKAFDVFPAISVPDLFMKRVEEDAEWTLFDPAEVLAVTGKALQDMHNEEFNAFYSQLENNEQLQLKSTTSAKELFKKFLKTTVETGMPYVFYRDTVNRLNPNNHA